MLNKKWKLHCRYLKFKRDIILKTLLHRIHEEAVGNVYFEHCQ